MQTYYTLKDIQTLLLQKYPKLKWNYEIYDSRTGEKISASIKNFTENMQDTLTLACTYNVNNDYPLIISVSDFAFLVYEDETNILGSGSTRRLKYNLTNNWISLLLSEHGYGYAKKLICYCEKRKEQINHNATEEITKHIQKIKAKAKLETLPYEKLIQKASTVLQSSEFVEEKES